MDGVLYCIAQSLCLLMFVMLCVAYTCLVSPLAESWYGVGPVYICERMDTFLCVCLYPFFVSVCIPS